MMRYRVNFNVDDELLFDILVLYHYSVKGKCKKSEFIMYVRDQLYSFGVEGAGLGGNGTDDYDDHYLQKVETLFIKWFK